MPDCPFWSRRSTATVRGNRLVEVGRAAKKENRGRWYVVDRCGFGPDRLYDDWRSAYLDYRERCARLSAGDGGLKPKG